MNKLPAIEKLEPNVHVSSGGKTYVSLRLPKLERWEDGWKLVHHQAGPVSAARSEARSKSKAPGSGMLN